MITIDCLIEHHPIAPHHHAIGEHGASVATICDFWEDNACKHSDVMGPVFLGLAPQDLMDAGQDFHPVEENR